MTLEELKQALIDAGVEDVDSALHSLYEEMKQTFEHQEEHKEEEKHDEMSEEEKRKKVFGI